MVSSSYGQAVEHRSAREVLSKVLPWFRAKCLQLRRETLPARLLELTDAEEDLVSVIMLLSLCLSLIRPLLPGRVSYSVF